MPRLVTLLTCEKVIVDGDGVPSLISLFENIQLAPSEGQGIDAVPKETITFKEWAVFSEWKVDADEVGSTADQILEVQYPDGSMAPIKGKIPFVFSNPGIHRNHQNIVGFPVGQEGTYNVRVWLEKDGRAITEAGTCELKVLHKVPPGARTRETIGTSPA